MMATIGPALPGFGIALVVTFVLTPVCRRWYVRRGWVDDPGPRKRHGIPTPLAGGAAVLCGLAASALALMCLRGHDRTVDALMLGAVALFLLGWWDDVVELGPASKLTGQCLVALGCVGLGFRLPLDGGGAAGQWLASFLFFLAVLNALNFLDNMNGLCAGLGVVAGLQLGWIGARLGRDDLSLVSWALAGACAGFLPYNYPRGQSFLGDSGSHIVGGLLALLTMMACRTDVRPPAGSGSAWGALWVLAVPAFDLIQVTLVRFLRRRPIYVGDNNHVSHLLAARFGREKAVLILWAAAALVGMVGVLSVRPVVR